MFDPAESFGLFFVNDQGTTRLTTPGFFVMAAVLGFSALLILQRAAR